MKRGGPIQRKTGLVAKTPLKATNGLKQGGPLKVKRKKATPARAAAAGKPCQIRIPGYCLPGNDTVVSAHYRLATGGGQKPDDEQAADACQVCHDIVDRRIRPKEFTHDQVRLWHAEGVFRTQIARREERENG